MPSLSDLNAAPLRCCYRGASSHYNTPSEQSQGRFIAAEHTRIQTIKKEGGFSFIYLFQFQFFFFFFFFWFRLASLPLEYDRYELLQEKQKECSRKWAVEFSSERPK